jgi:CrcB protein
MLSLWVALAAGCGAVLRYVLDQLVQRRSGAAFPYGTLVVNTTGSFVLGLAVGGLSGSAAVVLGAGFAGGYTTLSTLAWETIALAEEGSVLEASLNLLGSVALGLAAAALGLALTSG